MTWNPFRDLGKDRKDEEKVAEMLRRSAAFPDAGEKDLRAIARAGQLVVNLPAGWTMIHEETPADKAYVLLDGELSVRRGGEEIARLTEGDILGEVGILHHKLRTASVVTETDATLLHLSSDRVRELVETIPAVASVFEATAESRD